MFSLRDRKRPNPSLIHGQLIDRINSYLDRENRKIVMEVPFSKLTGKILTTFVEQVILPGSLACVGTDLFSPISSLIALIAQLLNGLLGLVPSIYSQFLKPLKRQTPRQPSPGVSHALIPRSGLIQSNCAMNNQLLYNPQGAID